MAARGSSADAENEGLPRHQKLSLGTAIANLSTRPSARRARYLARKSLDRIDNEAVRRGRALMRALRKHPPDVLYLGDSTVSFVAPEDTDRRRLDTMIKDALGEEVSVHVVDGRGFNPDIYDAYLRLLEGVSVRPLVVVPLCIRVRTPLTEHPVYGHKRALQKIRSADPSRGAWRLHGAWPKPTEAEFEAYYRLPYSTLLGEGFVGDYVKRINELERTAEDDDERVRMLYAYHHGGLLESASPKMEAVTRMGRTLRELGCAAVAYQTPVPVGTGAALLGPELAVRTAASFAALNEAYRLGAGEDAEIVESGTCFSADEFIDPRDATEHLNEAGRRRLTELIVSAVKQQLKLD